MDKLNLFSKLNPSAIDVSFIVRKDTDLKMITDSIKSVVDIYSVAGVSISNQVLPVELELLFNAISINLVNAGRSQCTPNWVQNAALATFLPLSAQSDINLLTGKPVTYRRPPFISELSDMEMERLTGDVKNWAVNKKMY